jgi:MoaA/NifB/PqqE/SkfB family radical SAM enzyme
MSLGMHSNASGRTPEWWAELARVIGSKGYVAFGIDGLSDTNHIYRRGTFWDKIMENAKAFIGAGGRAQWDFIVFKHNQHQIAEARELSKLMGFDRFNIKRTGRFFKKDGTVQSNIVLDRHGKPEYEIHAPDDHVLQNPHLNNFGVIQKMFGDMRSYYDNTEISCKIAAKKRIFVSAEGHVLPCCWIASNLYDSNKSRLDNEIWQLLDQDADNVNGLKKDLEEIINGPYFKKIYDSWTIPSIKLGKLKTCARNCGTALDLYGNESQIHKIQASTRPA